MADLPLEQVLAVLERGGVVGYPTETVWGMATSPAFAAELTRRKGRETGKPLQVSCADTHAALALALPDARLQLLAQCWPGPLTIVARAAKTCPPALAPGGWVGLRVPSHPAALELLQQSGPLATTSLNRAGAQAAQTIKQARQAQDMGLVDCFYGAEQADALVYGQASTVIRLPLDPQAPPEILREGLFTQLQLQAVLSGATVGGTAQTGAGA